MSSKENDLASSLDPREILAYLNELGIRNVNSEVLKEFMRDLKKLIRLDQQNYSPPTKDNCEEFSDFVGPERLHSCSTFSSRSKSVNISERRKPLTNINSGINVAEQNINRKNVCKRVSSARMSERSKINRQSPLRSCNSKTSTQAQSNEKTKSNIIKIPIPERRKKSDPVTLYHHYNALWEKYKSKLPGENSWADLRWSIREKLAGVSQEKKPVRSVPTKEMLLKRQKGWIDP